MKKRILFPAFLAIHFITGVLFADASSEVNRKSAPTPADVQMLAKEFVKNLSGEFKLDNTKTEKLGDYNMPSIKNGDWILSDHPTPLVDNFTQRTSAVATIFVKSGNEFIRESTSLITENNTDAAGTTLSHSNPAYNNLMNGKRFTGVVELFGVKYMADYDLFRDKDGKVIGAYLVGIPLTK